MNRGFNYPATGKASSASHRGKLRQQDSIQTSSARHQASINKTDINIDDFGDMGSDEDDFQATSSNFIPPKPPSQPQYNLVPHGFLRDDDELIEEDYDGVPIDDSSSQESPKKRPWESSPRKSQSEEIRGAPITVLGSSSRDDFPYWPNPGRKQDTTSRNRPGLGSEAGRFDKKGESLLTSGVGDRTIPSRVEANRNVWNAQSFVRSNDDSNPFLKTSNKPSMSHDTGLVRNSYDDSSFIKTASTTRPSGISLAKGVSNSLFPSHSNTLGWNEKSKPVQSATPARAEQNKGFSQSLKGPAQPGPVLTPTSVASTSSQLEMLQAAALQQALAGLTQLGSQTGLNLLGAQNLLMQNPALAALVASGGMLSTGLSSAQPNTLNDSTMGSLLKSAVTAPMVDSARPNSGLLTYPLRSNVKGTSGSTPSKKSIPDGSGSTRYPAPDLGSLVFDPATGYRFDASTGLHYDANSGYFFNSELKIFLQWDKFTQTYLKVDNPPGVPRLMGTSIERLSYVKDLPLAPQSKGQQPPVFPGTPFSSSSSGLKGLNPSVDAPRASLQNENSQKGTFNPLMSTIPTDFSKPPPPLPYNIRPDSASQHIKADVPSAVEQKVATLPNYAETSLFNRLRKAKLAQNSQAKSDKKQWGSPDPLLEAIQKQTSEAIQKKRFETNESKGDVLNLNEILQRSRQFMQQKVGNLPYASNNEIDRHARRDRNRSHSGERRKLRSRSRSVGRPFKRSHSSERAGNRGGRSSMSPQHRRPAARSPERAGDRRRRSSMSPQQRRPVARSSERAGNRRGRSSMSPQPRRPTARSPERAGDRRGRSSMSPQHRRPAARSPESRSRGRPYSRGRSPNLRNHKRPSLSPARNQVSVARSRSPNYRGRGRGSLSPKSKRKRGPSRGRSPISRARDKASLSPEARRRRSASAGRSPLRRRGKPSISPESRRNPLKRGSSPERRSHGHRSISQELRKRHRTPEQRIQKRSRSPMVRVVLDESPGGSKIKERSPERNRKRSAERRVSAERRMVRRKLSPSNAKGYAECPERTKSEEDKTGRKSATEKHGAEGNSEKGSKHIPYETPHSTGKMSSGSNNDGSGYKSLSNLRNQGKDKREDETMRKKGNALLDKTRKHKDDSGSVGQTVEVDLTVESDDEKRNRANQRLVSERTFSSGWERKQQNSASQSLSSMKADRKAEALPSAENNKNLSDEGVINTKETEKDEKQLEEPSEFDFLNETLDDDKESTLIDEYEEILDYQDVDETAGLGGSNPTSIQAKPDAPRTLSPANKQSVGSPVLQVDSKEDIHQSSTSKFLIENKPASNEADVPLNKGIIKDGDESHKKDDPARLPQSQVDHFMDGKNVNSVEEGGSSEVHVRTVQDEVLPESKNESGKSNKIGKPTETKDTPDKDSERENITGTPGLGTLDSEGWSIVDSVGDQEDATEQLSTDLNSSSQNDKRNLEKVSLAVAKVPPAEVRNNLKSLKIQDGEIHVTQDTVATKMTSNAHNSQDEKASLSIQIRANENHPEVDKDDGNKEKSVALFTKKDENNEKPQGTDKASKEVIPQTETEESLSQVRSVSDIEKFLLLSSQEVEAKREQSNEPTANKNEKKRGVFSRLGQKLETSETGDEPKVVLELPAEPSLSSAGPSKKGPASTPPKGKPKIAKSSGTSKVSVTPKKSQKVDTKDPIGRLFSDKPNRQILIGPMNFIEPRKNFQAFTQKYMQRMLTLEKVKFRQVYVCHEDVTGAPYHYILVLFDSIKPASDWLKKHDGKFRCNEKLFSQIPGHTKMKLITGVESAMYFSDPNWVCKVCKKGNFPPRSLCFGCFQHKDPEGFSPLTILDKVRPPHRTSNFVGTPKLKFFVTKEKVIESAPPLDGFDIKNIEIIMDEEMGFPAGICVFEMLDYIDAGKLKKYLNRRDIEAVSVEMHEKPVVESVKAAPRVGVSKNPTKEPNNKVVNKPLKNVSVSERDVDEGGLLEIQSHEVQVPRGHSSSPSRVSQASGRLSPVPSREVRVPRDDYSPSPSQEPKVSSKRPLSSSREVRVVRRSLTPPREVRVRRDSVSPSRVPRRRSPSPPHHDQAARGRSPGPSHPVRLPRGRSPLRSTLSRDRFQSRSPGRHSRRSRSPRRNVPVFEGEPYPSTGIRSPREVSRGRTVREVSPRFRSRERPPRYQSPIPYRSPGRQSPSRYRSRSPVDVIPKRRSTSGFRSQSPVRPIKPDGRGNWSYPPPDPSNFRFEPRSGLDYDPTTTLYYEPKSCCFYNDDTNEWLEYDPRTGRYVLVR